MSDFKFRDFESGPSTGMDAFFASEPEIVTPVGQAPASVPVRRYRVASLNQLRGFQRIGADTLVNKSTNDLWSLTKDDNGTFYVQRLFRDDGNPLKG